MNLPFHINAGSETMEIRSDLDAKWNIHPVVVVMSTVRQLTRTDN